MIGPPRFQNVDALYTAELDAPCDKLASVVIGPTSNVASIIN